MSVHRVLRGGSYSYVTWGLRSALRFGDVPERRRWRIGFRIVVVRRKVP